MYRAVQSWVVVWIALGASADWTATADEVVDATTLRGKVVCGYQGWFRCPGDAANLGWVHWSRDRRQITPGTLTFEMWPDMSEYGPEERFAAPGFTYPDGRQAELFSSDNPAVVLRHFQWMRDYGIDGAWTWRREDDPEWQAFCRRFDAYSPWNPGNYLIDGSGRKYANTRYWADDLAECNRRGILWIPVVYPGFSWDNLTKQPPGTTEIARRGGRFLWEQFRELSKLGVDTVYVAMFDEVDEGTAIFKVTSAPPTQAHFVGYDGLPSNWYLRLVGEGARMLRGKNPIPAEIPIEPSGP